MKPFLPFLLVPALAYTGWTLSQHLPDATPLNPPTVSKLDPPPELGLPMAPPPDGAPVRVRMRALLPPAGVPTSSRNGELRQAMPAVDAILVNGARRVAQINGQPMAVGETLGSYRIAAIEPQRVLFVQTVMDKHQWVPVTDR